MAKWPYARWSAEWNDSFPCVNVYTFGDWRLGINKFNLLFIVDYLSVVRLNLIYVRKIGHRWQQTYRPDKYRMSNMWRSYFAKVMRSPNLRWNETFTLQVQFCNHGNPEIMLGLVIIMPTGHVLMYLSLRTTFTYICIFSVILTICQSTLIQLDLIKKHPRFILHSLE